MHPVPVAGRSLGQQLQSGACCESSRRVQCSRTDSNHTTTSTTPPAHHIHHVIHHATDTRQAPAAAHTASKALAGAAAIDDGSSLRQLVSKGKWKASGQQLGGSLGAVDHPHDHIPPSLHRTSHTQHNHYHHDRHSRRGPALTYHTSCTRSDSTTGVWTNQWCSDQPIGRSTEQVAQINQVCILAIWVCWSEKYYV